MINNSNSRALLGIAIFNRKDAKKAGSNVSMPTISPAVPNPRFSDAADGEQPKSELDTPFPESESSSDKSLPTHVRPFPHIL